jgi:hypothetical protein
VQDGIKCIVSFRVTTVEPFDIGFVTATEVLAGVWSVVVRAGTRVEVVILSVVVEGRDKERPPSWMIHAIPTENALLGRTVTGVWYPIGRSLAAIIAFVKHLRLLGAKERSLRLTGWPADLDVVASQLIISIILWSDSASNGRYNICVG